MYGVFFFQQLNSVWNSIVFHCCSNSQFCLPDGTSFGVTLISFLSQPSRKPQRYIFCTSFMLLTTEMHFYVFFLQTSEHTSWVKTKPFHNVYFFFRQPPALFPSSVHWLLVDAISDLCSYHIRLFSCVAFLSKAHEALPQDKNRQVRESSKIRTKSSSGTG